MLKYLQMVDCDNFSIYKIFKSVDVRSKKALIHMINVYADGFVGKNEDYSENLNRIEIDIIKAIQGGCNTRELKTNDAVKRITHPKAANNNCFSSVFSLAYQVLNTNFPKKSVILLEKNLTWNTIHGSMLSLRLIYFANTARMEHVD
jgi:hypothetical protein